jgi:kinesin family protein 5
VEIYKEKIRDLLDRKKDNLTILEDKNKGLFVTEATEENVTSLDEAMSVMARGIKNRKVEETNCNTESSRSHAIFLLTIYKHDIIEKETKTSQLVR